MLLGLGVGPCVAWDLLGGAPAPSAFDDILIRIDMDELSAQTAETAVDVLPNTGGSMADPTLFAGHTKWTFKGQWGATGHYYARTGSGFSGYESTTFAAQTGKEFTFAGIVAYPSNAGNSSIVAGWEANGSVNAFQMRVFGDASVGYEGTKGADVDYGSGHIMAFQVWTACVLTFDRDGENKLKVFIDGTETGSSPTLTKDAALWTEFRFSDSSARRGDMLYHKSYAWNRLLSGTELTELHAEMAATVAALNA